MSNGLVVRPGVVSDAPAVQEIYATAVLTSAATFDTVAPDAEHWAGVIDEGHLLVAVHDDAVVGYAKYGVYRPRPAYAPTVETSVYVAESAWGTGVASALYAKLFELLDENKDVHLAVAGISLPNDASVALHTRLGFRHVGTFHEMGLKFDRWYDVAWFERPTGRLHR